MRSNPVARIISGAIALSLLAPSTASAQLNTDFPQEIGETLLTAVVTNALDDTFANDTIEAAVKDYHRDKLGGKGTDPRSSKPNRRNRNQAAQVGFMAFPDQPDTDQVSRTVAEVAGTFRQAGLDLMVVSGGDGEANVSVASINNGTMIIDLDQSTPCVTSNGRGDPGGACEGGTAAIPPNYAAVEFAVEDGAYLAGVLAAKASRGRRLGVINGYAGCEECERYVQGFLNGARSVEPEISIEVVELADDEVFGFGDSTSAKTFTEAFIEVFQPAVILPVGRAATPGMVEAACEANPVVLVVGTGTDITSSRPDLDDCVLTSVTKDLTRAINEAMFNFSWRENDRVTKYDLADGGVGVTDDWRRISWLPVDTKEFYEEAETGIRTGEIEACPGGCGEQATANVAVDG